MIRRLGSAAVAGLLLVACGGGDDSTTTASYGRAHDDTVDEGETTTTAASSNESTVTTAPVTTGGSDGLSPTPGDPGDPRVLNRTDRDDPSGLRLTFVVADKLRFGPDERIVMELTVANIATERRYLSGEQPGQFAIAPEGATTAAWSEEACRDTPFEPAPGPIIIDPGEDVRYVVEYPMNPSCRVAPGAYLAAGRVALCPTETMITTSNGQRRCDEARTEVIVATPLRIEITP